MPTLSRTINPTSRSSLEGLKPPLGSTYNQSSCPTYSLTFNPTFIPTSDPTSNPTLTQSSTETPTSIPAISSTINLTPIRSLNQPYHQLLIPLLIRLHSRPLI